MNEILTKSPLTPYRFLIESCVIELKCSKGFPFLGSVKTNGVKFKKN